MVTRRGKGRTDHEDNHGPEGATQRQLVSTSPPGPRISDCKTPICLQAARHISLNPDAAMVNYEGNLPLFLCFFSFFFGGGVFNMCSIVETSFQCSMMESD